MKLVFKKNAQINDVLKEIENTAKETMAENTDIEPGKTESDEDLLF